MLVYGGLVLSRYKRLRKYFYIFPLLVEENKRPSFWCRHIKVFLKGQNVSFGKSIQLNIELHQGAISGSLILASLQLERSYLSTYLKGEYKQAMQEIKTLDLNHTGIKPLNKLETFMLIEGTKHYYISSEGRLVNDIKGKFYLHNDTLSKRTNKVHWKIYYEDGSGSGYSKDVYADYLVAQAFLEPVKGRDRIYHIDGDGSNSRYGNLIYVSDKESRALRNGDIKVEDLGRVQKYVPFLNHSRMKAARLWNDMYSRCYNKKLHRRFPEYIGCTICDYWLEDRERFFKWVEENYYMVGEEQMDLDKDILCKGNKVYGPETSVFVPHAINTLLLNCRRKRGRYPIGVSHDRGRYRAALNIDGRNVKLGTYDTPKEAFMVYKKHKEALVLITADRYKGKIPDKVYDAMINWKIEIDD